MQECGQINIFVVENGQPVVQFTGGPAFGLLNALGKVLAIKAAQQLCDVIANKIIDDHPEEAAMIREMLASMSIEPFPSAAEMN